MQNAGAIAWLLAGDVSVQYATRRDLPGEDAGTRAPLQKRIATEGCGAPGRFIAEKAPTILTEFDAAGEKQTRVREAKP